MSEIATPRVGGRDWLRDALPKLVLSPSFAIVLVFVYGFIVFTFVLSFTDSRILPSFGWVGWQNYERLFGLRAWGIAVTNLLIFGSISVAFMPFVLGDRLIPVVTGLLEEGGSMIDHFGNYLVWLVS